MKKILLLAVLLAGCATHRAAQPTDGYNGILPTYDHLVGYRSKFNRPNVSSTLADQRSKAWVASTSRIISFQPQKPIRRKTDLVYLRNVPAYPLPDAGTFSPVRFWMTVDNQGDSTAVWVTNFEVDSKRGWEPIEKQSFDYLPAQALSFRLTDLDAMVTVMLDEFQERISKP